MHLVSQLSPLCSMSLTKLKLLLTGKLEVVSLEIRVLDSRVGFVFVEDEAVGVGVAVVRLGVELDERGLDVGVSVVNWELESVEVLDFRVEVVVFEDRVVDGSGEVVNTEIEVDGREVVAVVGFVIVFVVDLELVVVIFGLWSWGT